jgi:hypothetical protein
MMAGLQLLLRDNDTPQVDILEKHEQKRSSSETRKLLRKRGKGGTKNKGVMPAIIHAIL